MHIIAQIEDPEGEQAFVCQAHFNQKQCHVAAGTHDHNVLINVLKEE